MVNKIKQFFKMISYNFKKIDNDFLGTYLTSEEMLLIKKLKKSELHHSILVAKDIKKELDKNLIKISFINYKASIKAGLLHDIGKIQFQINIFEKSVATIIKKIYKDEKSPFDSYEFYKSYIYHGKRGAEILKKYKSFEENKELYDVIKYHHISLNRFRKIKDFNIKTIKFFELLQYSDDHN